MGCVAAVPEALADDGLQVGVVPGQPTCLQGVLKDCAGAWP